MEKKILIPIIGLLVIVGVGLAYLQISSTRPSENQAAPSQGPFATFLCIHMEPGAISPDYQVEHWPHVIGLVELADNYGAKLALEFAPQYAEYILENAARFNLVKGWQQNGHEIALQHHAPGHQGVWDGYTDNPASQALPQYQGSTENMAAWLRQLAAPENLLTAVVGPDNDLEHEWPAGVKYRTYGVVEGSVSKPVDNLIRGSPVKSVLHQYVYFGCSPQQPLGQLSTVQSEFLNAKPDEIVGVILHDMDYPKDSGTILRSWLEFLKGKNYSVRTVKDILSHYLA